MYYTNKVIYCIYSDPWDLSRSLLSFYIGQVPITYVLVLTDKWTEKDQFLEYLNLSPSMRYYSPLEITKQIIKEVGRGNTNNDFFKLIKLEDGVRSYLYINRYIKCDMRKQHTRGYLEKKLSNTITNSLTCSNVFPPGRVELMAGYKESIYSPFQKCNWKEMSLISENPILDIEHLFYTEEWLQSNQMFPAQWIKGIECYLSDYFSKTLDSADKNL